MVSDRSERWRTRTKVAGKVVRVVAKPASEKGSRHRSPVRAANRVVSRAVVSRAVVSVRATRTAKTRLLLETVPRLGRGFFMSE
jgi:hypothetical protein